MMRAVQFPGTRRGLCVAATVFVLATIGHLAGCAILGYVANNAFPDKVKAAYRLQDRPTVIVADDPSSLLDDHAFLLQVAHQVGEELTHRRALSQVIPSSRLVKLSTRLGEEFGRLPIDRVGQELGAEQVVHVNIESVAVSHTRMALQCQVKVIDAVNSIRLFPAPVALRDGPDTRSMGRISVQIVHATATDVRRGERVMVGRDLGHRVSVEVVRLFVDHELPKRSERLNTARS